MCTMRLADNRRVLVLFITILSMALPPSRSLAQTFTGLGVLPGGRASYGGGVGYGATGSVGWSHTSCFTCAHAFRWTSNGMQDLGTFGGPQSFAGRISNDGSVVVGESNTPTGLRAFRWTSDAGMQDLGTLPDGNQSAAR